MQSFVDYNQLGIVEGLLFGVMGAGLSLVYILLSGAVASVVGAARQRLDARIGRWPRVVVLATAGGAVTGALGWAMPLTLTDGAAQLNTVLMQGGAVGSGVLAASAFTKMLAYHVRDLVLWVGGWGYTVGCGRIWE